HEARERLEDERGGGAGERAGGTAAQRERGPRLREAGELRVAAQPSRRHLAIAGDAGLEVVLRVEVGARRVWAAEGMHDRQRAVAVVLAQRLQRGMEPEESVEVERLPAGDGQLAAQRVVAVVPDRRHQREPVRASAQQEQHEDRVGARGTSRRSEEHTSELQSREKLVCRLLLEKKKQNSEWDS